MKHILTFTHVSDTKGTYRYQELDETGEKQVHSRDAVVGALYIRKSAFDKAPAILTVTVEG